jgi:hypothetical protein
LVFFLGNRAEFEDKKKVGEGAFGEVFLFGGAEKEKTVLKITATGKTQKYTNKGLMVSSRSDVAMEVIKTG